MHNKIKEKMEDFQKPFRLAMNELEKQNSHMRSMIENSSFTKLVENVNSVFNCKLEKQIDGTRILFDDKFKLSSNMFRSLESNFEKLRDQFNIKKYCFESLNLNVNLGTLKVEDNIIGKLKLNYWSMFKKLVLESSLSHIFKSKLYELPMLQIRACIENIAKLSYSRQDIMRQLNWHLNGTYNRYTNELIEMFNISIDHFDSHIKHRVYAIEKKQCPVCDKVFEERIGNPRERTCCSHGCSNTYFRSKENNPNWKGGVKNDRPYRLICFKTWEEICSIPGCNWKKSLSVHHIDENNKNNDPLNLIPLCLNHHNLIHTLEYGDKMKRIVDKLSEKHWKIYSIKEAREYYHSLNDKG